MKNTSLILPLLLFFVVAGCDLLRFDKDKPPPPGRRDYVWKVDTLYSPPSGLIYGMWGSSPNDVWAVGGGTGIYNLFHYNGSEWKVWSGIGGVLESIYGFAKNDVWMGGNDGRIYHFDGIKWSLTFTYKPEGTYISAITDIWGSSSKNIFAVGVLAKDDGTDTFQSFLLHYNGRNWNVIYNSDFDAQFVRVRAYRGNAYILALRPGSYPVPDTWLIYRYSNRQLKDIMNRTTNEFNTFSMNTVGGYLSSNIDNELLLLTGSDFQSTMIFHDLQSIVSIEGRHVNDLFIFTWDEVFHHNGHDLQNLLTGLPRNVFRSLFFSKDVFFLIRDFNSNSNLIYHGTLNEQEE